VDQPLFQRGGVSQASSVHLVGNSVAPGRRASLDLPVAELPTGTWLSVPVEVVCGVERGPSIWLSATIHGEELNGLEIIHRVLKKIDPQQLRGVVIAAPVLNVLGFMTQARMLPDGSDLNRSFPGSEDGSLAERLAHWFMTNVVAQCSFGIDLHSGANNRINPPQIRADLNDPETRRMAEAFAAPILMNTEASEGSLREAAVKAGKRALLFEGGEPLRFNADALRAGTRGVLRVLHALGMRRKRPKLPHKPPVEVSSDATWVKAPRCGILRLQVKVRSEVRENQELGGVADVLGGNSEKILAPYDGVVIGASLNPLVAQGGGVVHLARRVR
jgi:predicted deacylase